MRWSSSSNWSSRTMSFCDRCWWLFFSSEQQIIRSTSLGRNWSKSESESFQSKTFSRVFVSFSFRPLKAEQGSILERIFAKESSFVPFVGSLWLKKKDLLIELQLFKSRRSTSFASKSENGLTGCSSSRWRKKILGIFRKLVCKQKFANFAKKFRLWQFDKKYWSISNGHLKSWTWPIIWSSKSYRALELFLGFLCH